MTKVHAAVDLTPMGDRVLVEPEDDRVTDGGLIRPDNVQDVQATGYVVAVGPGRQNDDGQWLPGQVRVGDRIRFMVRGGTFYATEVKLGSAKYYLVPPMAIIGVLGEGVRVAADRPSTLLVS